MAQLPDVYLAQTTAVLRVPHHVPQVPSVAVLHTDVGGIAAGGIGEPLGEVTRFDDVRVVESLSEF